MTLFYIPTCTPQTVRTIPLNGYTHTKLCPEDPLTQLYTPHTDPMTQLHSHQTLSGGFQVTVIPTPNSVRRIP